MPTYNGDIYLGLSGNEILLSPFGRKLSISDEKISRSDRTTSGRLVEDIITTKKKFKLVYSTIDGDELLKLINLYMLYSELSLLVYTDEMLTTTPEPGTNYVAYTVLMAPLDRERLLLCSPNAAGLWENVTVVLDEV